MSSGDTKFRQLLVELQPPMTAASTWVQVKRAVSAPSLLRLCVDHAELQPIWGSGPHPSPPRPSQFSAAPKRHRRTAAGSLIMQAIMQRPGD